MPNKSARLAALAALSLASLSQAACSRESLSTAPADGAVLAKAPVVGDPTATFSLPASGSSGVFGDAYSLTTDGRSLYRNGDCGVTTRIFATADGSGSGDATMQTDNPGAKPRKCATYPRTITLRYVNETGAGVVDSRAVFMNLRAIATLGDAMQIGETRQTILAITFGGRSEHCSTFRWNPMFQGVPNGSSYVTVQRVDAITYRAWTEPGQKAYCADNGLEYEIPVDLTVVASRAI